MKIHFQGHKYEFEDSDCSLFTFEHSNYFEIRFNKDLDISDFVKSLETKFLMRFVESISDKDLKIIIENEDIYLKGTLCQIRHPLDLPEMVVKAKLISTKTRFELFE